MIISYHILKKENLNNSEFKNVLKTAEDLKLFLNHELTQKKIKETHKLHAKSGEIQEILIEEAKRLGFETEKKGLFIDYQTSSLRPDYFKKIGTSSGIIMEVERGKTTINNMDLLDVWKCHICKNANYLFLIIPKIRQNGKGGTSPTFSLVQKRLESFFIKENYINIDAIFLFGY